MAKVLPWDDVISSESFAKLPPEKQQAAQRVYFAKHIAPRVPEEKQGAAWDAMRTRTARAGVLKGMEEGGLPAAQGPQRAQVPLREDTTPGRPLVLRSSQNPEPSVTGASESRRRRAEALGRPTADARPDPSLEYSAADSLRESLGDAGEGALDTAKAAVGEGAVRAGDFFVTGLPDMAARGARALLTRRREGSIGDVAIVNPIAELYAASGLPQIEPLKDTEFYQDSYRPRIEALNEILREQYSQETQRQQQNVGQAVQDAAAKFGGDAFADQFFAGLEAMLKNPRALAVTTGSSLPDMLTGSAVSRAATLKRYEDAYSIWSRAGATPVMARQMATKAASLPGTLVAAGTEGAQAGVMAADGVAHTIDNTSDNELMAMSGGVRARVKAGESMDKIRLALKADAMDTAMTVSTLVTSGAALATGAASVVARLGLLGKAAGTVTRRKVANAAVEGGKAGVKEGVQEGIQEGGDAVAENLAMIEVGAEINPLEGAGAQAGAAVLPGAVMGGGAGAMSGYSEGQARRRAAPAAAVTPPSGAAPPLPTSPPAPGQPGAQPPAAPPPGAPPAAAGPTGDPIVDSFGEDDIEQSVQEEDAAPQQTQQEASPNAPGAAQAAEAPALAPGAAPQAQPEAAQGTEPSEAAPAKRPFKEVIAEFRHKRDERAAAIKAAMVEESVEVVGKTGDKALISPDASKPGKYRMTQFDGETPTGHLEFESLEAATTHAAAQGYVPAKKEAPAAEPPAGKADLAAELASTSDEELAAMFDEAAHEAATSPKNHLPEPTPAQAEAGNYRHGHARIYGMDVSIEYPEGSTRRSKPGAPKWERTMADHYGYIKGTSGADGEHIDVFVNPQGTSEAVSRTRAYVVDQIDPKTGNFNEHKVLIGYRTENDARRAYERNYPEGWKGLGAISPVKVKALKKWLEKPRTRPFKGVSTLKPMDEPRLNDEQTRQNLQTMTNDAGWSQIGGRILRGEDGEVNARTTWIPASPWFGDVQRTEKLTGNLDGKATKEAVRRALAGEPMTEVQKRHVAAMIDWARAEQEAYAEEGAGEIDPFAMAGAVTEVLLDEPSTVDAALVARAMELDPAATEQAIETELDDAAYMRRIKEIVDGQQNQVAQAAAGGEAVPRPQGPAREQSQPPGLGSVAPVAEAEPLALTPASPEELRAEAERIQALEDEERKENEAAKRRRAAEGNQKEKDRRAAEIIKEREAAKKAEVDAAAATFQLGQAAPAPVERKVTTEQAIGQKDLLGSPAPDTPQPQPGASAPAPSGPSAEQAPPGSAETGGAPAPRGGEKIPGTKALGERLGNEQIDADANFIEQATERGLNKAQAVAALEFFRKKKLAKLDHVNRRYTLKSGNLWDRDQLLMAAYPQLQEKIVADAAALGVPAEEVAAAVDEYYGEKRYDEANMALNARVVQRRPKGGTKADVERRRAERAALKPALTDELAATSDEALSAMFDQAVEGGKVAETEKPLAERAPSTPDKTALRVQKAPAEKAPGEIAKDVAANLGSAGENAVKALDELFGIGKGTTLRNGLGFDEQKYQRAKPHFQAMLRDVQAAGKGVKDFVAAVLTRWGSGIKPYLMRFVQDVRQENENAAATRNDLERDRPHPGDQGRQLALDDGDVAGRPDEGARAQGDGTGEAGSATGGGAVIPARGPALEGEPSNQPVHPENRPAGPSLFAPGSDVDQRGGEYGDSRAPVETVPSGAVAPAARGNVSAAERQKQQARADDVPVKEGLDNVRETLPLLTDGQQEDVHTAETRFAKEDGYGMLFTNGTGTGKSWVALGAIKRAVRQGKTSILMVAPNDKIIADLIAVGAKMGVTVTKLADTRDAGKGVVITTYANLRENVAIARRKWDMVVTDEAHYLSQDADGTTSDALKAIRALTMHPRGAVKRYEMLHPKLASEYNHNRDEIEAKEKKMRRTGDPAERSKLRGEIAGHEQRMRELQPAVNKAIDEAQAEIGANQGHKRPRVLFLSATPFAYEKTVDWADGYLFDYGGQHSDGHQKFFMQHFGYRMRYGKLTQPGPGVDRAIMQRQFNGWLKQQGVLAGRVLDVDADYDRKFILTESAIGNRIDAALEWVREKASEFHTAHQDSADKAPNGYTMLDDVLKQSFDYLSRRYLLEAIKANEVLPLIRENLAMGRKVVVFHDYKKGNGEDGSGYNPFDIKERTVKGLYEIGAESAAKRGEKLKDEDQALADAETERRDAFNQAAREFREAFKDLVEAPLADMPSPIKVFQREFGGEALLFNGDVSPMKRRAAVEKFQDDDSGPQVLLVQSDAGKEGISLHDTTGKHQRILFNLGQPTKPTSAIQQEGRIYRTGQVTDAIFRYLNTGTNWEKWAFATVIATRASEADNLGQGEQARALKDAYISAFEESASYPAGHEGEGKGGKERDRRSNSAITEFDRAKSFYWGTAKKSAKTKAQEGTDYFATPEPLGLKMIEWSDIRQGEHSLEPSGGHGAIARWMPDGTTRVAIEPSSALGARLVLVFDGKLIIGTFEDHNVVNKYDTITMNPPFGVGGKTAVEHLRKAVTHLRDGGRIVVLLPRGPAADKRVEQWLHGEEEVAGKPMGKVAAGEYYEGDIVQLSGRDEGSRFRIVGTDDYGLELQNIATPGASPIVARSHYITKITPGPRKTMVKPGAGLYVVGEILLPQVTFERAGTQVASRILVIDKVSSPKLAPDAVKLDYSSVDTVKELFERIEQAKVPERTKKRPAESAPADPVAADSKPRDKKVKPEKKAEPVGTFDRKGAPIISHTTQAGKELRGIVAKGITRAQAEAVDPYTFPKGDGFFIRQKHLKPDIQAKATDKPAGRLTPQAVRAIAKEAFGEGVWRLEAKGGPLTIAPTVGSLPQSVQDWIANFEKESGSRVVAVTDRASGRVYIIADRIAADDVARVYLHEIGAHHSLETMMGEKGYARLIRRLKKMHEIGGGGATLKNAWAEVVKNYAYEEGSPNFMEELVAHIGENQPQSSWWQEVLSAVRRFLFKLGFTKALSDEDVRYMVLASLRAAMQPGGMNALTEPALAMQAAGRSGSALKGVVDSLQGHAEALSDLLQGQPISAKLRRLSDVDLAAVAGHVVGMAQDHKVLGSIVRALPVDVVDFLARKKITAEHFLRDKAMLKDMLSGNGETPVSLGVDEPIVASLMGAVARQAAEVARLTGRTFKDGAAGSTGAGDTVFGAHATKDVTKTSAFSRWFAGSKVVDAEGKPLVVYHGTAGVSLKSGRFQPTRGSIYFTDDSNYASQYAGNRSMQYDDAPAIAPVFLSLQNPLDARPFGDRDTILKDLFAAVPGLKESQYGRDLVDRFRRADGAFAFWQLLRTEPEMGDALRAAGFDGAIQIEGGKTVYVAFRPEQVKSAIGNNGNFDPNDPSILAAARRPPSKAPTNPQQPLPLGTQQIGIPEEHWLRRIQRRWQDKMNRWVEVQRAVAAAGRTLTEDMNVDQKEQLYYGKTDSRLKTFEQMTVEPLAKLMGQLKVTIEELDKFLYAKHAPEANAYVASINSAFPDGGSGMTTADAQAYLASLQPARAAELDRLARMVYAMNEAKLRILERMGLADPKQLAAWRSQYLYYVPLKSDIDPNAPGTGRGYDVRGPESKKRLGRGSQASSPLLNSIRDYQRAVIRGGKAEVGRAVLALVKANPDLKRADGMPLWEIKDPTQFMRRTIVSRSFTNPITGQVTTVQDVEWTFDPSFRMADNVFSVKVNGKEKWLQINDDVLADQIKNLGDAQVPGFLRVLAAATRFMSALHTGWNPEFWITNFSRDLQTALIHLGDLKDQGVTAAKIKRRVALDVFNLRGGVIRAIAQQELRQVSNNPSVTSWQLWLRALEADGGRVGYFSMKELTDLAKDVNSTIKKFSGNPNAAKAAFTGMIDATLAVNTAIENALRLATYRRLVEAGVSRQQAAFAAKNLTVNFNKKGEWSNNAGAFWMFFNASIQGTARASQALFRSKTVRTVAVAYMLSGAFAALWNALVGGDDEEKKQAKSDQYSDWAKNTNLLLLAPDGEAALKIPLAYGYNLPYVMGYRAVEAMVNPNRGLGDFMGNLVGAAVGVFDPTGAGEAVGQARKGDPLGAVPVMFPSTVKPLAEVMVNRNFMGHSIHPEAYGPEDTKPDSERAWSKTPEFWKTLARTTNELTGGSEYEAGGISVSPETLQHIWQGYIGGIGRTITAGVFDPIVNLASERAPWARVDDAPFVRKVVATPYPGYTAQRFYEIKKAISGKDKIIKDQDAPDDLYDETSVNWGSAVDAMDVADKHIRDIRKHLKQAESDEERNMLEAELEFEMNSAIAAYNEARAAYNEARAAQ